MSAVPGLVSVVIPFFNPNERFLQEAVESVMLQTYSNWEIILVDDGSLEGAGLWAARAIADRMKDRVRLVTYDEPGNRGASAARNEGFRHTKGEYVAFLDADDVWLPEKLRIEVSALNVHTTAGMVYSSYLYWYSWGQREEDMQRNWVPALGIKPNVIISPPKLVTMFLHGTTAVPTPSCVMFRKEVLVAVRGWESSFPGLYDDQVLFAKVGLRFPVVALGTLTTFYRQHGLSLCAAATAGAEREARARFLSWLEVEATTGGAVSPLLTAAILKEKWLLHHPWVARTARMARRMTIRFGSRR